MEERIGLHLARESKVSAPTLYPPGHSLRYKGILLLQAQDDLTGFLHWWLKKRPFRPPLDNSINHNGVISGTVLYRQPPYQVQLFIVPPNSEIKSHIHPDVDSYEVYMTGDIKFWSDDVLYETTNPGMFIRVHPQSPHGGDFGEKGGCFLSVQKWLNGVEPTSVGNNWDDKDSNRVGTASLKDSNESTTTKTEERA